MALAPDVLKDINLNGGMPGHTMAHGDSHQFFPAWIAIRLPACRLKVMQVCLSMHRAAGAHWYSWHVEEGARAGELAMISWLLFDFVLHLPNLLPH